MAEQAHWAIGLMSGTSLDGIDAALLRSDGETIAEFGATLHVAYEPEFRSRLRALIEGLGDATMLERELTRRHAEVVEQLLERANLQEADITVIGFHGQTISHQPEQRKTWQLGDGALLAQETGIDVVGQFRLRDVEAGGQGAPLVPIFHAALAAAVEKPVAILNLGGIGNVTWVGENEEELLAFDTGPGNVLLNEWMLAKTGKAMDEGGNTALKGEWDSTVYETYMADEYFAKAPPKSLDRQYFTLNPMRHLSLEDGANTLAAVTAAAVEDGMQFYPAPVKATYVCGGGRHNAAIMRYLQEYVGNVRPIEELGLNGDMIEAQAFAYLALRSQRGLPITFPATTGVTQALTGGVFYPA